MALIFGLLVSRGWGDTLLVERALKGEALWWTQPAALPGPYSPFAFKVSYQSDTFQRLEVSGSWAFERGNWVGVVEPYLAVGNDSLYPPPWHGVRGDFRRAFLGYVGHPVQVFFGRVPLRWGPPLRENLLFSAKYPPPDGGVASLELGPVRITQAFLWLDPYLFSYQIDTPNNLEIRDAYNRFVNAHRVEFKVWRLTFSWSEAVFYSRLNGPPELAYFNPLSLYYAFNWNWSFVAEDDYIWVFDACLSLEGLLLYGEFFVDDFQYVAEEGWDPNQTAGAAGFVKAFGEWRLRGEAAYATRWTYNSRLKTTKKIYMGYPLGHPRGSDFLETYWELRRGPWAGFAQAFWDGAGSIEERMPYGNEGFPKETFLVPPVKRGLYFGLRHAGRLGPLWAGLEGGWRSYRGSGPFFRGALIICF